MSDRSFQDQGSVSHCFGCGPDNASGLQLRSYWEGEEAIATFRPKPYHCGWTSEVVYGGLVASLMDCHACNLAIAHLYRLENREIGSEPKIYCATAQLNVALQRPTPIDATLHLRARIASVERRKIRVTCDLSARNETTARGEVLVIRLRDGRSSPAAPTQARSSSG